MNVISLISRRAIQNPDSIAIKFEGEELTFRDLLFRAKRLADYLAEDGIQKGNIGICLEYSPRIIVTVLAAMILGVTFIPIDPNYPPDRINHILNNSNIACLISETQLLHNFTLKHFKIINLDSAYEVADKLSDSVELFPTIDPFSDRLIYILYTSGTTSKPKGVMIRQKSLIDAYYSWKKAYELQSIDIHLQLASFSFDVFYGDLIRSLCSGATLVLCPRNILLKPKLLFNLIEKEKITVVEFVPAVLRNLVNYLLKNEAKFSFIRLLVCGSDNWSVGEYKKFRNVCGNPVRLINSYGLTEATIDSCYFELTARLEQELVDEDSVPIGKPFPNTEIYLLDKEQSPITDNEIGEIYISGSGLAEGYYDNPTLTQTKFNEINIAGRKIRLLRTGDLGRYITEGNIQLVGRIDNQIKLNGKRIELSDIENNLNQHPAINGSIVALHKKENGYRYLAAYIVLSEQEAVSEPELRDFLKKNIPNYMIPKTFIKLDKMPLTPNGKIDRKFCKEG